MTWVTEYAETEPSVAIPAPAFEAYRELAGDFEVLDLSSVPSGTLWLSIKSHRLVEARFTADDLRTVKVLRIISDSLRSLDLPQAPALEALELRCPSLAQLPPAPAWPRLKSLYIANAQFDHLPSTLGGARLKKVFLGGCHHLTALPQDRSAWLAVRDLNLHGCGLASLPDWFQALSSLTHCSLAENRFADPDALKPLWRCTSLKGLGLRLNGFHAVPEEIGELSQLKDLVIESNPIAALPGGLSGCAALEVLLMSYTKLSTIPPVLAALPKLKHVEAMGTGIRADDAKAFKKQHGLRTTFLAKNG